MFIRKLALTLFLGVVIAGLTVGVAGAGGFPTTGTIPASPPATFVDLPANCVFQFDFAQQTTEYSCKASAPNPDPPKKRKTVSFDMIEGTAAHCQVIARPDGSVKMTCRFNKLLL